MYNNKAPLPPGKHVIHFKVDVIDITYNMTVVPRSPVIK